MSSLDVRNNKDTSVIEKALEGKVSFTDFKSYVTNFVTDHNNAGHIDASFSKHYIDFNLVNGLIPVVETSDTSPNAYRTDTITIMNTSKKNKLYYYIDVVKSPKFELIVEPKEGIIKKGSVGNVTFKIRIFCTTRIYQIGKIYLAPNNPTKSSKVWWPTKTPEKLKAAVEQPQLQYLSFRIESDLSTSFDYDDLELGKQLARGGFGTVYNAKWRGSEVAVKMLSQDMVPEEKEQVQREISLMSKLNFQFIVTYMGSTKIPSQPLCIVMEYVQEGSLKKLLKKPLDFGFKLKLALDIAKGLAFLHSNNIAHRDIKPDNVLVVSPHKGAHVNVKLTDFGTSRCDACYNKPSFDLAKSRSSSIPSLGSYSSGTLSDRSTSRSNNPSNRPMIDDSTGRTTMTKGVGTLIYSAPEILNGDSEYDTQMTDIYSYGILLWELFLQKEPYSEPPMDKWTSREIAEHVIKGRRLDLPSSLHPELIQLIKACWSQEADSRPPCIEIVKKLEVLVADKPEPQPKDIQNEIGWHGEIEREEAEALLHGTTNGTFLFRWSKKQNSFVLSYKDESAKDVRRPFSHIAGISQGKNDNRVVVKTVSGQVVYNSFLEYVEAMRRNKVVTNALVPRPPEEAVYGVSTLPDQQYVSVSSLKSVQ